MGCQTSTQTIINVFTIIIIIIIVGVVVQTMVNLRM